ncbi:XdhC family protein [Rhizobium leucaenae]|uniref:Xanthine dehydrogenase accessory factor n=1 Tax=Rhizobium leucaenae TaxID=29450 RepID=A0A7W6ZX61_9HYPH|nr:XdhC family protein [Rhizobium leucaenae]MBB4569877.1 xanthine dehydrogenase accessory factor [Rhizobium leucaenae]MBB6299610.1 xanthine dehydrogenase accessory factor [Rhizobium leucaenae]
MDRQVLTKLNRLRRARQAVILATELSGGQDRLIVEGDAIDGPFADAVASAFRSGKSSIAEIGGQSLFLNVHLPPPQIVVIGAVHISQVLAGMAELAGFDIRIIDPRTAFATPERFDGADLIADWPVDVLKERPLDAYTALVAVTHDPKIDDFPIAEALKVGCFYVGALGSRKTHASRVERLKREGLTEADLARIHAPIGLPIGASSPAEIAVAILAEIIAALRGRDVSSPKGDKR